MPVWEEPDGFCLAQSMAITGYLARAHGLFGKTARETAQCEQALGAFEDLRGEVRKLVTVAADQRAALRAELTTTILPRWLGYLERILRANRDGAGFFVGDAVSVADLAAYYLVELLQDNGFGAALAKSPRLAALAGRIAARPRIAAYLKSPRRWPFAPLPT